MRKFLISLYVYIQLYRMGYFWGGAFNRDWGFYRLNYEKKDVKEFSLLDIDFNTGEGHIFSHIHGGKLNSTIFRLDENKITESSKLEFGFEKMCGDKIDKSATFDLIYNRDVILSHLSPFETNDNAEPIRLLKGEKND